MGLIYPDVCHRDYETLKRLAVRMSKTIAAGNTMRIHAYKQVLERAHLDVETTFDDVSITTFGDPVEKKVRGPMTICVTHTDSGITFAKSRIYPDSREIGGPIPSEPPAPVLTDHPMKGTW